MVRPVISILITAALLLPGSVHAAETVKLRPLAPIYVDSKGGGIRHPEGVGCGGNSTLVVADTGSARLLTYAISAETAAVKGEFALAQLPYPIKAQVNSGGDIVALDGKSRRIVRISSTGEFKGFIDIGGVTGSVVPRSFRIGPEDALYIIDVFSARLIVADSSGKARLQIPFPKGAGFLSDLAVDKKGDAFLIDSVGKRIFAARKGASEMVPLTESLGEDVDFPTSIAVDDRGRLFVGDQNGGGIVVIGPDGSFRGRQLAMGWKNSFLRYPSDLCIDGSGTLFVADRGNNRVQSFAIVQ